MRKLKAEYVIRTLFWKSWRFFARVCSSYTCKALLLSREKRSYNRCSDERVDRSMDF